MTLGSVDGDVILTAEPPMPIWHFPGVIVCSVRHNQSSLPSPIKLNSPGRGLCVTMETDGTCSRPSTGCGTVGSISATCTTIDRLSTIRMFNKAFVGIDFGGYQCDYEDKCDTIQVTNTNSNYTFFYQFTNLSFPIVLVLLLYVIFY